MADFTHTQNIKINEKTYFDFLGLISTYTLTLILSFFMSVPPSKRPLLWRGTLNTRL